MLNIPNRTPEIQERLVVIGTRGSALARWQTVHVTGALQHIAPALRIETRVIKTAGDQDQTTPLAAFGGLGVFTKELEHALLEGGIDIAVHSLKDLPTDLPPPLTLAAFLPRQDARDVLVSRHHAGLMQLPPGPRIGTASARRTAQILALRPDAKIVPLRGNVDTRLHKAHGDEYDAIVLAAAGLIRLGLAHEITEYLSLDMLLPDPGQGALAVQIRTGDDDLAHLLAQLDHAPTRAAVTAERAFLQALGGGCRTPIGAYAEPRAGGLRVRGMVGSLDGEQMVKGEIWGDASDAYELGQGLAWQLLGKGAARILSEGLPFAAPLHHKRIIVTRAAEQAEELALKIRARGGETIVFPTLEFAPPAEFDVLDDALARIAEYQWVVFTSANGVRATAQRLDALRLTPTLFQDARVAAIGPGTARALEQLNVRVDLIPTKYLGEQIARELPVEAGQRVLLLRADIASDVLAEVLNARGARVSDVDVYRTQMPAVRATDLDGADAITFTSSSTVRHFMAMVDDAGRAEALARDVFCIGPVTAGTAREFGLTVSAVAEPHTLDGLVSAMVKFYGGD